MAYQGRHSKNGNGTRRMVTEQREQTGRADRAGRASHGPASHGAVARPDAGKRRRRVSNLLLILGIAMMVAAGIGLGRILWNYHEGDATYSAISVAHDMTESSPTEGTGYEMTIDWSSLSATNPDTVGWVYVPDTDIDYPIVQGTDNSYYLNHDFNGDTSSFGAIFMDYESSPDLSDRNTIVYGHHMRNGSMFATLIEYTDTAFLAAHPYIFLATPSMGTRRLKPFCVVKASGDEMLRRTSFTDDGDFASFVQAALDRNDVETDITADQVSHLYMFSTCSYEFDDARTIVYAVEVDEQGDPIANT